MQNVEFRLLAPFLWGGALAVFLNLPLTWLERRLQKLLPRKPRLRRGAALGLLLLALTAGIGFGLWLLVPQLLAAAAQLAAELPALLQRLGDWAGRQAALQGLQPVGRAGESAAAEALRTGMDALVNAVGRAGEFVLALVLAVYLLADKETLARKAGQLVTALVGPQRAQKVREFGCRAQQVFGSFVVGQCVEAAILAGLFVLVLFVFGFPNVLPVAAVIGVTALVPVFGAFVGCAVGVLLVLPAGVETAGWFVLVFLCVQQLENNLIYPHVVGKRVGLPPLVVLAAVILGGGLFGVPGLVLGIPAASVAYHLGRHWVHARLVAQEE